MIAAVNGPAAGAGFSLALACDTRIASENAFFACAYGRIGASPDGGMTYFLPRVVGPGKALELLINDPNLDAQAALDAGLVSEVVPAGEALKRALGLARRLAELPRHAAAVAKQAIEAVPESSRAVAILIERLAYATLAQTADARAAADAFERRPRE